MNAEASNTPRVSIIVPVYAVEQYIGQCAASLFGQTWENLEFIFVDNGTPDGSVAVLRQVMESYPQRAQDVKILKEERKGLGYTRVAGLREASGDYIIHVDSDDWVEPDFIEKLVGKALSEDADAVYCDYFKEYDGHPEKTKTVREKDIKGDGPEAYLLAIHNSWIQSYVWNKLVKRSLYDLEHFVTPIRNMHEDIVFQTQVLYHAHKMVHLKEALYHYRRKRAGAITAGSWFKTRRMSAEGLLHLYSSLAKENSPLDFIAQDLLMRAGWYAVSTFNFATLKSCPEAVDYLSRMSYIRGHRVPLSKQRMLRAYCRMVRSRV